MVNEKKMLNCKINGLAVSVPEGSTILDAAQAAHVHIPTLCYMKEINEIGACRICLVEASGARGMVAACVHPIYEGMEVKTNTAKIQQARRTTLELILSTHDKRCLSCVRSGNCELQTLCQEYGVEYDGKYDGYNPQYELDDSAVHLVRDNNKCILCRRCVAACQQQYVSVIGANDRGMDTNIDTAFGKSLGDTPCISCGQCIVVCPTGALTEKDDTAPAWAALNDDTKHVVVQTAPSIRATLGECFNMPIGTNVKGKMVAAARRLGFDAVFDTDFGADMTIVEEASELIHRIQNNGVLPMITSCSPGWVNFCELYYGDQLDHLSSCKSPQQMTGSVIKTYYAKKMNIDPKDIIVVSVMPCTAKKGEIAREGQHGAGGNIPDVDVVLTTREFSRMVKRAGIDFVNLPDEDFDNPLGQETGAAVIFGATGGVMEAALRTANDLISGKSNESVDFQEVRGIAGIKEATYNIAGMDVKVAVASGAANANYIMSKIKNGTADWHFIEIMGCPGGCVNGGGQPIQPMYVRNTVNLRAERAKVLYDLDATYEFRKSHESPVVKTVYEEFFGEFGGHKAHELLHTNYKPRQKFRKSKKSKN